MVMSSSLQCFWQVWLSSLPELNSLHSMQSLQKDTERERLSTEKGWEREASGSTIFIVRMDLFQRQISEEANSCRSGDCLPFGCRKLYISYFKIPPKIKAEAWPGADVQDTSTSARCQPAPSLHLTTTWAQKCSAQQIWVASI